MVYDARASKEVVLQNTQVERSNRPVSAVLSCPNSEFGQDGANGNAARATSAGVLNILPTAFKSGFKVSQKEHDMAPAIAPLAIGETIIRQHDGLYCLNDLHQAAGGEAKHRPNYFLNIEQTKELTGEIEKAGIPAISAKPKVGTYACRELVIAYAAWISPAFHLKVIRVFLAAVAPQATPYSIHPTQTLTAEQAQQLRDMLQEAARRLPQERQGAFMVQGWSKLKAHFKTDYRHIPAAQFADAVCLLARHIADVPLPPSMDEAAQQLLEHLKQWQATRPSRLADLVRDPGYEVTPRELREIADACFGRVEALLDTAQRRAGLLA